MLILCRESCRLHFAQNSHLLDREDMDLFLSLGGANDTARDPFGYEHNVCDLSLGFHSVARKRLLKSWFSYLHQEIYVTQSG